MPASSAARVCGGCWRANQQVILGRSRVALGKQPQHNRSRVARTTCKERNHAIRRGGGRFEVHEDSMIRRLRPQEQINEAELQGGLRALLYDGVFAQVMGSFTGGAFLVAFALSLGASNVVIGLLAAVGPLTQILQIPAIFLVDKTGLRKTLVVLNSLLSRAVWLVVAALPWIVPAEQRVAVLLLCLFLYFGLGTLSGCAFNSWMRDFIPPNIMGSYFGKRLAIATATGAALTLAAGFGIEVAKRVLPDAHAPYSIIFLLGGIAGLIGVYFLSRIPEPKMAPHVPQGIFTVLAAPFSDFNFRRLLMFLGSWNFAINLAAPFFVVYMVTPARHVAGVRADALGAQPGD